MFRANEDTQFVPTKNVSIRPESMITYSQDVNQPKFLIPASLGYIDPTSLYLKYNLRMTGRGYHTPDDIAGAISLWNRCRIVTGDGRTEMESLEDTNVLTGVLWNYGENNSIFNKRSLYEGKSENSGEDLGQCQYWADPGGAGRTENPHKELLQIQHAVPNSGIIGHDGRVFPLLVTNGLRVEFELEKAVRGLMNWKSTSVANVNEGSGFGHCDGGINATSSAWESPDWLAIQGCDDAGNPIDPASGTNTCTGLMQNPAVIQTCVMQLVGDASPARNADNSIRAMEGNGTVNMERNPYCVGDLLYIATVAAAGDQDGPGACEPLGVVTGFDVTTANRLQINYAPYGRGRGAGGALAVAYPAGSALFVQPSDRWNRNTWGNVGTFLDPVPAAIAIQPGAGYELTDLQMIMNQVSPPAGYTEALQSQVASQGLNLDYKTHTLYRHNVETLSGLTNQIIPAVQNRAYGVLSIPLDSENQYNTNKGVESSLVGAIDGMQAYQYVVGGSLQPNREVETSRYQLNGGGDSGEPMHLSELEKAIQAQGRVVRSWWGVQKDFLVGRAFALNGQVHNIGNGDLALRARYLDADAPKLFDHFISHLNTATIRADGVSVQR